MVGFHSVSCRLSIGLKSGDPIPNLTRSDPGWFYGVFSNIVGGRQLADSLKILRFCRFRVGLAGVTGVSQSVLVRFCRFGVGLYSGRQIFRGEIFQTCLKDLSPTNCRLSVGYMSVWCRDCLGAFEDVSV